MKRRQGLFGLALAASCLIGCEGGIQEGGPAEIPKSSRTNEFMEAMKTAGPKMQSKGKGAMKKVGAAPAAP
jgi:hypothetical protein